MIECTLLAMHNLIEVGIEESKVKGPLTVIIWTLTISTKLAILPRNLSCTLFVPFYRYLQYYLSTGNGYILNVISRIFEIAHLLMDWFSHK